MFSKKKKGLHKNFSGDLQKKSSQKFFRRSPQKNVFQKIFQALHKILTIQKILLSSSRGQANFRGLYLRGQGLQNLSSRTPPLHHSNKFFLTISSTSHLWLTKKTCCINLPMPNQGLREGFQGVHRTRA